MAVKICGDSFHVEVGTVSHFFGDPGKKWGGGGGAEVSKSRFWGGLFIRVGGNLQNPNGKVALTKKVHGFVLCSHT